MPETAAALNRLATLCGIQPVHTDVFGREHRVSDATQRSLLMAMGIACDDLQGAEAAIAEWEARDRRRLLPAAVVVREGDPITIRMNLDPALRETRVEWTLELEQGEPRHGHWDPPSLATLDEEAHERRSVQAVLDTEIPAGYHELQVRHGSRRARMSLIRAPRSCYVPEAFGSDARLWGVSAQLYSLRSHHNWGMGDFGDLPSLVERCAAEGGQALGLNPLHAMFPHNPRHVSPYSPSSRLFLNVLYIDVASTPEVEASREARERMASHAFQSALAERRAAEFVDYAGVAALKQEILELAFTTFRTAEDAARREAFAAFCEEHGEALYRHALFEALQEHFHAEDPDVWGWPTWPHAYRDPASAAVARFARSNADRIDFFRWLQWLADAQLAAVGRQARDARMAVGLYFDLAVSVDRGGAETWANQHLYALGASIGAPPDVFNARGQNWGLPPQNPLALRESGYALYIDTLQRLMRHGGAIRIDHVMMLLRLFWVPEGASPEEGAYVSYPMDDLLGILALESRRNRCLVIGEDLGTVPDEIRTALGGMGVLSYRLAYFEQHHVGAFKQPSEYPRQALVSVSTHDLPTWVGWWEGNDLHWRSRLGLFPTPELERDQYADREKDREGMRRLLGEADLLPEQGADAIAMGRAVQRLLARSPSMLQMLQIEDALGLAEQANLPSTVDEHPNWRRRLPVALEDLVRDENFLAAVDAIRTERGPQPSARSGGALQAPAIPRATYRLQLHHAFTFTDARKLVDYLDALGISHCYTSPYLQSRPGSMHGYDTIDHDRLDPELGSERDYQRLVAALRERSMSHVADIVSNHMGVGPDNEWWLDVLEHGQAARHARFFDIDWTPAERALTGKLLLPVLGDLYGKVLESGELQLVYERDGGRFVVRYHEHRFPLDPREYPYVLATEPAAASAGTGADAQPTLPVELASLAAAFRKLPPRTSTGEAAVTERYRDAEVLRERLLTQYRSDPAVARIVDARVAAINGSAPTLHRLLDRQAWRLAHWRTASDEINYRRFFDINDLAALRAEDAAVFEASHRRILELVGAGAVGGLRIDHPDGLYDPAGYYRRLVARVREVLPPGTPPFYLVVEKILGAHEKLPEDWTVSGTTGYEFSFLLNGLQVDPAGQRPLTRAYARFIDRAIDFDQLLYECKHQVIRRSLASELQVLTNRLHTLAQKNPVTRDFTRGGLAEALREFTACFPVYRSYITGPNSGASSGAEVSEQDRHHIDWGIAQAKRRSGFAELSAFDFLRDVLLQRNGGVADPAALDFTMKLQQFTSPVMAKAMEDTAFYRYHRLVSLNEVGGDPRRWGLSVAAFHHENARRLASWPHNLLGTTTHDTKRSEDVRARLNVLSEIPAAWQARVRAWQRYNRRLVRKLDSGPAPSRNDEYLLYQTLLGSWPLEALDAGGLADYAERIRAYAQKAAREAKERTSWIAPDADYEAALDAFITALLDPDRGALFQSDFLEFKRAVAHVGLLNSLSQTLLKLTVPGVPDVYQGTELWNFSLVDPDNRRPVDYAQRARLLDALGTSQQVPALDFDALVDEEGGGRCKLDLMRRVLAVRRRLPELFESGEYVPCEVQGDHAERICAFARCAGDDVALVVAPRLMYPLTDDGTRVPLGACWADTRIVLPGRIASVRGFTSVLDDAHHALTTHEQTTLAAADLFRLLPVALLVNARGVAA